MHHLPRVLILTAAVAAGCSDNPTSPTAPTAPPFANSYTVEFVASASCPNGGQGTMFQRTFQFEMVSRANSNTALGWSYHRRGTKPIPRGLHPIVAT